MQLTMGALGLSKSDTQGTAEWEHAKEALIQAIALITPKELCWRLGIKEQYLSDAIFERDRKSIKAAWIPTILAMAPDSAREAVLRALADPVRFDVARRKELTPEELNAKWEERVTSRFGAAGLELAKEMRR